MTEWRFEYQSEDGDWVEFGTASGSGDEHLQQALADLQDEGQAKLNVGRYRYQPIDGETERWQVFFLDPEGKPNLLDF